MRLWTALVSAALTATIATEANAVLITRQFDFTASSFSASLGYSTISGTFIVTYDLNTVVTDQPGVVAVNFNFPVASEIGYSHSSNGRLIIGGLANGAGNANGGGVDFYADIGNAGGDLAKLNGFYYSNGTTTVASAGSRTLTATTITNVPEPATWAMMIGGFGLVGATMRRRRTAHGNA